MPRTEAEALDAADPLAPLLDRFVIPNPDRIYLDGNSLGRLSIDARDALAAITEDWGERAVEGWRDWIELPTRVGDRLARVALGARPGEVLVADSVTVNLFKLVHAAADHRDGPIVTDAGNFPTDRYVLEGVARQRGREYIEAPSVEAAIEAAAGGTLCLAHVDYRSGVLLDMAAITSQTDAADALLVWDVSHSVGAVEVDLSGADLAVGCTYKYLNAGPGAPAFLYVRSDLKPELRSPIQGWFGRRDQFGMGRGYDPADGIERFAAGTPSISGLAAIDAGLGLIEECGIARIAAKSRALTELAARLTEEWLEPLGFRPGSPPEAHRRGAHLALRHHDAELICTGLLEHAGVVTDFRQPDILRLGFSPMTTRFTDVWDGLDRLRSLAAGFDRRDS
ncbi:MAG: kynureninase [Candidatus Limnocylindria bacterium]